MSNMCVCHLEEYCFYCEQYLTLQSKYNKLKNGEPIKALKQLRDDLINESKEAHRKSIQHLFDTSSSLYMQKAREYANIAKKIEEVIAQYDPIQSRSNPDGRGEDDPTKQVEGQ